MRLVQSLGHGRRFWAGCNDIINNLNLCVVDRLFALEMQYGRNDRCGCFMQSSHLFRMCNARSVLCPSSLDYST